MKTSSLPKSYSDSSQPLQEPTVIPLNSGEVRQELGKTFIKEKNVNAYFMGGWYDKSTGEAQFNSLEGKMNFVYGKYYSLKASKSGLSGSLRFEEEDNGIYIFNGNMSYSEQQPNSEQPQSPTLRLIEGGMASEEDDTTSLEQVLTDLPWRASYNYGSGIDAITGLPIAAKALLAFETTASKSHQTQEMLDSFTSFTEVQKKIEASTTGNYNIEEVSVDNTNKFLNEISQSSLSISYLVQYHVTEEGYSSALDGYQFTAEAAKMIQTSPEKFRSAYGDYFVAGAQSASTFQALYILKAETASDLTHFENTVGVSVPGLFSQQGSVAFEEAAKSNNMEVSVKVQMTGISSPTDQPSVNLPSDVPTALAWFKKHLAPTPFKAKLFHFSRLQPGYSTTIDVSPDDFSELQLLYGTLWDIRVMYNSLPSFYANQYQTEFTHLDTQITSQKASLPTDRKERQALQKEAHKLHKILSGIRARQKIYEKVKDLVKTEPAQGQSIEETSSSNFWTYGITSNPDPDNIQLFVSKPNVSDGAPGCGYRTAHLNFESDESHLLLGWQVVSVREDGYNGHWKKSVPQILLQNNASVFVKGWFDRAINWTVYFYYVKASDYQFD